MPDQEAIERGLFFEKKVSNFLGGRQQPGSGNQFHSKSDVTANGLLLSCKSQKTFSWSEIKRYLDQAIRDAFGTGDIPALALENDNEEYIVMRLSDFSKALKEVKIPEKFESKGLAKRSTAEVPLMLR